MRRNCGFVSRFLAPCSLTPTWLSIAAASRGGSLALDVSAAAPVAQKQFNVPGGDASTTLKQFAAQSAEPIVYMVDNVRGEKTNAISGNLTPRAALEQMLEGTGLTPSQDPATGAF